MVRFTNKDESTLDEMLQDLTNYTVDLVDRRLLSSSDAEKYYAMIDKFENILYEDKPLDDVDA